MIFFPNNSMRQAKSQIWLILISPHLKAHYSHYKRSILGISIWILMLDLGCPLYLLNTNLETCIHFLQIGSVRLWSFFGGSGLIGFLAKIANTGKSLSEALIYASTNTQYDDRLFIEFQAQTWGEYVVYRNCF